MTPQEIILSFSDSTEIHFQKAKDSDDLKNALEIINIGYSPHRNTNKEILTLSEQFVVDADFFDAGIGAVVMADVYYLAKYNGYSWVADRSEQKLNILSYARTVERAMEIMALWLTKFQDTSDTSKLKISHYRHDGPVAKRVNIQTNKEA